MMSIISFIELTVNICEYVLCFRKLFPSKMSTSLNMTDLHPKVTYCFSEGSTVRYLLSFLTLTQNQVTVFNCLFVCRQVLNGMSLSGLETFVQEQECGLTVAGRARRSSETRDKDRATLGRSHGTGCRSSQTLCTEAWSLKPP